MLYAGLDLSRKRVDVCLLDLFGTRGRALLDAFELPEAWRTSTDASLRVIGHLDEEIDTCERELRRLVLTTPTCRCS